jgi:monofunctional glycosyltransferase
VQEFYTNIRQKSVQVIIWAKSNKFLALVYFACSILVIQYLLLPNYSLQSLRKNNPAQTALMKQRLNEAESNGKPMKISQRWVPLSKISQHLIHAVVVSEDGTFYQHEGVDWYEVEESIVKNLEKGKAARGGSTISQQLVKNLYLSTSKDPIRKFKELIITLRLEKSLSKRRILEIYLNVIEWGNGVFRAEAASQKYFGKSALLLTREEAAQMASVIPSPRRHQPNIVSKYVANRTAIILNRMSARGY